MAGASLEGDGESQSIVEGESLIVLRRALEPDKDNPGKRWFRWTLRSRTGFTGDLCASSNGCVFEAEPSE